MRVAAILGLDSSINQLKPFALGSDAPWQLGLPASPNEADAVLVLGGDGTVHRHLPQLVKLQLPALVVPYGSGNDFARALGLRSVSDAVKAWRRFSAGGENVNRIDLGVISPIPGPNKSFADADESHGHYFCCVGGVGLDAEVARHANRLPRVVRRRGGYLLSLLSALSGLQPVRIRVETQQEDRLIRHDGPTMLVSFANTPSYGGGIRIAPHARLDDGKLDVFIVGAMAKLRLLRLFPSVSSGRHVTLPEVQYFQAERLRIETAKPSDVYADGEYVCTTPVEVTVARAALRVIVPARIT